MFGFFNKKPVEPAKPRNDIEDTVLVSEDFKFVFTVDIRDTPTYSLFIVNSNISGYACGRHYDDKSGLNACIDDFCGELELIIKQVRGLKWKDNNDDTRNL